jgi:LytS/YehU family sensor histidine kinase
MFYRKSFSLEPTTLITLEEEFELLELYVEMEEVRFEDQLKVDFEVSADVRNALVPPLILQPLLEETIKYGLQSSRKLTHVVLSAKACDDRLQVTIEDDGRANEASQTKPIVSSMDLARMRLEHAFAGQYRLSTTDKPGRGHIVQIDVPLRTSPGT